jgi:phosphoribosyl-AMP cyclohydrolase
MKNNRETGSDFDPKFDANGLITAVVSDIADGAILMVAHMNAEAIAKTLASGTVYFYSRSRKALWQKGESSGNLLHLVEAFIDCDQDAIWIKALPDGPTCHTGVRSCFYRRLTADGLVAL